MIPNDKRFWFAISAVVLATWTAAASVSAGVPTEQIRSTVDRAILVLKDPRLKPAAKTKERRAQLKQILFGRFDFTEMAKRALGTNWRRRTPKEQEEFVQLFSELLERAYADIIESYSEEKIIYIGERLDGGYADVASKVLASNGAEYSLNYKAHYVNSEWRVYDVIAENISVVNNFRSQFNRVIAKSSYEELVRRLREKAEFGAPKR
ncbi:MAG TPA: ABC transporter substrate-binding protein [Candidatus Binatia bacterium]